MKGWSCGLFLCLFLGIACFSGYQVLRILHEYRVGADAYFKLEQFASLPLRRRRRRRRRQSWPGRRWTSRPWRR